MNPGLAVAAGGAKLSLVSLAAASLSLGTQEPAAEAAKGSAPAGPQHSLQLNRLQFNLDPDALLCAAGVAEAVVSLKQLLPGPLAQRAQGAEPSGQQHRQELPAWPESAAGPSSGGVGLDGAAAGPAAEPNEAVDIASLNQQRTATAAGSGSSLGAESQADSPAAAAAPSPSPSPILALGWDSCSVALPLSAELAVGLELGAAAGQWRQPGAGSLALQATELTINGGLAALGSLLL